MNSYNKFKHAPCHAYFDSFGNLIIENGTMIYPNLAGRDIDGRVTESPERKDGLRSFKVFIDDPEFAKQLNDDGFSISMTKPDEDGNVLYLLKCKVSYRFFEPKIVMHNSKNNNIYLRTVEDVDQIDQDDILNESINLIIKPSKYKTKAGKEGLSSYVKEMHYMIEANPFADKYLANIGADLAPEDE